ncbi:MAG TPA: class I SAM-dependent methyltransferase [Thermoanaerobaculia bacterium]|nr:class I SAM-dependent methyltransferase [Thermoanaerobaculia bacterium]
MDREEHWERVYGAKPATQVSWYAPHLERSIRIIRAVAHPPAEIIDVGGGASTLVDDLLALGYTNVSVLDISSTALAAAKARLGAQAAMVKWIVGDVTSMDLPREEYDVWHDRAAFHFLTEPADRRDYVELATSSLKVGAHAILAAYSLEGPTHCSGLDVVRYSAETMNRELGPAFALQQETHESHRTPSGAEQKFIYCLFERVKVSNREHG